MGRSVALMQSVRPSLGALLLLLAAMLPAAVSGEGQFDAPVTLVGRAVRVPDGDTIHVKTDGRVEKVRIAGVDAPELGQPCSRVARTALVELVSGRDLALRCDKRNVYGRLICVVRVEGADVGLRLVSIGLAWHFKRYEHEQSAEDRLAYSMAEEDARRQGSGLFRQSHPMPPWDCRQRKREGESCEVPARAQP